MADREKVIKGLEMHEKKRAGVGCLECPYAEAEGGTDDWCIRGLHRDILALLKEQEPARAIREFSDGDKDGSWWYECGNCLNPIDFHDVFCSYCGKRLMWND